MSETIDKKVVEMQFNNQQFESGVQETLSTLDKLKKALHLDGAAKGFESISTAANSVTLDGISTAVNTISGRFSALGTFVGRIFENMADDAYAAGKRLAMSLSTDQITAGWSKYADKTASVQTIMSATAKDFSDTGEQMEYVNEQLAKLNWFTDETSYDFLEMVNNIGKFTNNNIKLDDAVTSMEGISTWAALAGANSNEASRAMYNLSQAIGAGSVKLIDWKSIENANMATAEFKETAMQTAVELGILSKKYDILKPQGNYKGDDRVDVSNFAQTLSSGWFTSDVLTATLKKYGAFTDQLYVATEAFGDQYSTVSELLQDLDKYSKGTLNLDEILKNTGMTAKEVTSIFDTLASSEMELGKKGFKAAQEAKTFQEAIDATKDAVSTGWMNTFELIFGNYEEAKQLWTNFANELYDIFASGSEARNELLSGWKEQGGRDLLLEGISESWKGLVTILGSVKEAFREVFPPMTSERLVKITETFRNMSVKFNEFSEMVAPYVKRAFTGIFTALKLIGNTVIAVVKGFSPLIKNLKDIATVIVGVLVYLGDFTVGLSDAAEEMDVFEKITSRVYSVVSILSDFLSNFVSNTITSFIEGGKGLSGVLNVLFDTLSNLTKMIFDMASAATGIDFSNIRDKIVTFVQTIKIAVIDNIGGILDFLKGIPEAISSIFKRLTGLNIGDVAEDIKNKASDMLSAVKEAFDGFKDVDMSGVDSFAERVKIRFEPIGKLFDGVKKLFKGIVDFLKKLAPLFGILASKLGDALGGVGEAISGSVQNADFNTLFDIVNGGILVGIGLGIKKFINNVSSVAEKGSGFLSQIEGILDGVKGCFEAWQQDIKENVLLKIAGAIAILTASLVVLSMIDSDKLSVSLAAVTAEFIELLSAMKIFTTMVNGKGTTSIAKIGTLMITMSVSILILAGAMKKLSVIDWNGISKGIVSIGALSAMLVLSAQELSKSSGHLVKGSVGLIAFAIAIRTLVKPVKELGEIDTKQLASGLISVGVLCAELAAFLKVADLDKSGLLKGVGLMAVAEAVNIIAKACAKFGEMDTKQLAIGIAAIGAVLLELAVFTKLTENSKHVMTTATGMVILGAALNVLSGSVQKFGSINFDVLTQGLIGMAIVLAEVAAAMKLMPATTPIIATGLVLVGAALNIVSSAIKSMGTMDAEDLSQGLIALGSSLAVIALGLVAMKGSTGGAAALLIFASALAILTPCLKALGKMSLKQIGKSLLTLAGTFTVIGVAGYALAPVTPVILALSAAVALLGAGTLACGVGVLALSAGLSALAVAGTAGISILIVAIEAIIVLIPQIITKVGEGIISVIKLIGDSADTIAQTVTQISLAIIASLQNAVQPLIETVIRILDELLASLSEHFPTMLDSIVSMCMDILRAISDNIGEITDIVLGILVDVLEGIANKLPDLIQAGIDIVISLIDGLAEGIENNAQRMRDAFVHLFKSMLEAILVLLGIHSPSEVFSDIGVNLILGLIKGIGSMLSALLKLIGELVLSLLKAIKDKLVKFYEKGKEILSYIINGIASKIVEIKDKIAEVITGCINTIKNKLIYFFTKGKEIITNIKDGITDKTHELVEKAGNVISSVIDAIKGAFEDFKEIGSYLIDGLKEGISDAASAVADTAKGVVSDAVDAVADFLGINSPSRLFAEFGRQTDAGYIVGLNAYSDKVSEASENIGKEAVDGISSAISLIADTLDSDLDYEPTIRPILDINDVMNGVGSIDNMLASKRALNLSADADVTMNSAVSAKNQNGITVDNKDVISALSALRSDVSSLASIIGNLKIVMDTGELVGTLTNPLDISLGRRALYEGRGI